MSGLLWERVIVVDTETGGLNPEVNAVLSVALVASHGRSIEVKVRDTAGACTPEALAVNGIDLAEHMRSAPDPRDAAAEVSDFLQRLERDYGKLGEKWWIGGHNVAFDLGFLRRLYQLAGLADRMPRIFGPHRTLDTHTLLWARFAQGEIPYEATSSDGAFKHFGFDVSGRHTALGDAIATRDLLGRLVAGRTRPEIDLAEREEIQTSIGKILGLDIGGHGPAIYRARLRDVVGERMFARDIASILEHFLARCEDMRPELTNDQIINAQTYLRERTTTRT